MRDNISPDTGMRRTITSALFDLSVSPDRRSINAAFLLPADSPIFAGHFPGMPVIPAVYQVALCAEAVRRTGSYELAGISRSRFSKMCVPSIKYDLKILLAEKGSGVEATCAIHHAEDDELCSKIVLILKSN
jgi:3-hydroxyacyl-[acyl-carrier-protein] dehydratase